MEHTTHATGHARTWHVPVLPWRWPSYWRSYSGHCGISFTPAKNNCPRPQTQPAAIGSDIFVAFPTAQRTATAVPLLDNIAKKENRPVALRLLRHNAGFRRLAQRAICTAGTPATCLGNFWWQGPGLLHRAKRSSPWCWEPCASWAVFLLRS